MYVLRGHHTYTAWKTLAVQMSVCSLYDWLETWGLTHNFPKQLYIRISHFTKQISFFTSLISMDPPRPFRIKPYLVGYFIDT